MSLLIKALDKAEKNSRQPNITATKTPHISPEPAAAGRTAAPVTGITTQYSRPILNQPRQGDQRAAANVFAAKRDAIVRQKFWWIIGSLGLLGLLGLAVFYGYLHHLQTPDGMMPAASTANNTRILPGNNVAKTPQTAVVAASPTAATNAAPDNSAVEPANASIVLPEQATQKIAEVTAMTTDKNLANIASISDQHLSTPPSGDATLENLPEKSAEGQTPTLQANSNAGYKAAPTKRAYQPRKSLGANTVIVSAGTPMQTDLNAQVKISNSSPRSEVDPTLAAAYRAYTQHEDTKAQSLYRQVLRGDARNVDALLGMAAIAQRQQRVNDANGWYQQVLNLEPRNETAQLGLLALQQQAQPAGSENRYREMLATEPNSAELHAAQGAYYIGQAQWREAQQSYFDAYRLQPNNAEYAFNLAVCLDQLGKSGVALEYYRKAQQLLEGGSNTSINRQQLAARIAQLQGQ